MTDTATPQTVGERLRQLREDIGWTQRRVGLALGLRSPQSGTANRERGKTTLPRAELRKLSQVFEMAEDEAFPMCADARKRRAEIAARFRELREKSGHSQSRVGRELGLQQSAISEREGGNVTISTAEMEALAEFLEMPLAEAFPMCVEDVGG
jgi:transcriptional regulator with XRE-family HTH domain